MARIRRRDKSRWQLDRERFCLTDPEPTPSESPVSVRNVIMDIFTKMATGDRCVWRQVEQEWGNLVGPVIARHARPVRLERKTLGVAVDSAVWLNELIRYERASILARLQQRFGADRIKTIHFQAGPALTRSH